MPKPAAAKRSRETVESLVIRDAETLKAMAEPTRLQILLELGDGPKTVKEVAAELGLGATRLYYHFKILERAKLIRVAGRRMVSGIEERSYVATAENWMTEPESGSTLVQSGLIGALLNVVQVELELALDTQGPAPLGDPASSVPVISFTRLALSEEDVEKVQRLIEGIMLDHTVRGPAPKNKRLYNALFAAYHAPSELKDRP